MDHDPRGQHDLLVGLTSGLLCMALGIWVLFFSPDADAWAAFVASLRDTPHQAILFAGIKP